MESTFLGFSVVVNDIPWPDTTGNDPTAPDARNPSKYYDVMTIERIKAIPMKKLSSKNGVMIMWTTGAHMANAIDIGRAWGYHFAGMFQTWVKTAKGGTQQAMNTGFLTRVDCEYMLYWRAKKSGKLPTKDDRPRNIKQVYIDNDLSPLMWYLNGATKSDRGEHSEKPPIFYEHITKIFKPPYVDVFARRYHNIDGWLSVGNELDGLDIFDSIPQIVDGSYNGLAFMSPEYRKALYRGL